MPNETKKRLLLSKWRAGLLSLREEVEGLQEKIDAYEWEASEQVETLELVKYWLHDGLVHHKLISNPREILRKVEDALS